MPSENDKILKFNQYVKSENTACLTNNGCTNNAENVSTRQIGQHIPF